MPLRLVYAHSTESVARGAMPLATRAMLESTLALAWQDYLQEGGNPNNPEAFWTYVVVEADV